MILGFEKKNHLLPRRVEKMVEKECSKFGGAKTVMRRSVVIH